MVLESTPGATRSLAARSRYCIAQRGYSPVRVNVAPCTPLFLGALTAAVPVPELRRDQHPPSRGPLLRCPSATAGRSSPG